MEPVRSRRTKVDFFQGWADDVDFKSKTITIEEAVDEYVSRSTKEEQR
jgi:NADH dehydrogenase FAD-containing subunit